MIDYREFKDPQELIAALSKGYVLYQAPLDSRPYTVKIQRYTINCQKPLKSTLTFWHSETGTLTVGLAEHFERFRVREDMPVADSCGEHYPEPCPLAHCDKRGNRHSQTQMRAMQGKHFHSEA